MSTPVSIDYFDVFGDRIFVWGLRDDTTGAVAWGGAQNLNAAVPDLATMDGNHGKGTPGLGPFQVTPPPPA